MQVPTFEPVPRVLTQETLMVDHTPNNALRLRHVKGFFFPTGLYTQHIRNLPKNFVLSHVVK